MEITQGFINGLSKALDDVLPSLIRECESHSDLPFDDYRRAAMCLFSNVGLDVSIDMESERLKISNHIRDSEGCHGLKSYVQRLPQVRDADSYKSQDGVNFRMKVYPNYVESLIDKAHINNLLSDAKSLTLKKEKYSEHEQLLMLNRKVDYVFEYQQLEKYLQAQFERSLTFLKYREGYSSGVYKRYVTNIADNDLYLGIQYRVDSFKSEIKRGDIIFPEIEAFIANDAGILRTKKQKTLIEEGNDFGFLSMATPPSFNCYPWKIGSLGDELVTILRKFEFYVRLNSFFINSYMNFIQSGIELYLSKKQQ